MSKLIVENKFYFNSTKKDKILFIINFKSGICRKEITDILFYHPTSNPCYPVTLVTSVTSNENRGYKGNKSNEVTNIVTRTWDDEYNQIKVYINRLHAENLIEVDKSTAPHTYKVNEKGRHTVETKIHNYKIKEEEQEGLLETKEIRSKLAEFFVNYFWDNEVINKIYSNIAKGVFLGEIDLKKCAQINPDATFIIMDHPEDSLEIAETVLKTQLDYDLPPNEKISLTIANLTNSAQKTITSIRSKNINKLIGVVGEIKSRSQSAVQISSVTFQCVFCGNNTTLIQNDDAISKPSKCSNCKREDSKGSKVFVQHNNQMEDILKLVVSDIYENLHNNEVPEEINVYLRKDNYNFSRLKEGDKIQLIGIPKLENKSKNGKVLTSQEKVFYAYGLNKLDEDFSNEIVSPEDKNEFELIKKEPFEYIKDNVFYGLHDVDFQAKMLSLSLFEDFNLLVAGRPGTGKTEMCKRCAKIFPKGKFADITNSTESGIIGTVSKNEFTGRYSLDGGVFRPLHPGGLSVLDELNRDSEKNIQKTILGIMNNRRINLNKANSRIDEECKISIWCSANPIIKNSTKKQFEIFGMLEPLWDRFDFVIYYNNFLDMGDSGLIQKLLSENQKEFEVTEDLFVLKKYIIEQRKLKVKLGVEDYKKLSIVMKESLKKIDSEISYRRLKTVSKCLIAICRLFGDEAPSDKHYIILNDIFRGLFMEKQTYFKSLED